MRLETFYYNNVLVRNFVYATVFWGVIGMAAGLLVAFQLVFPELNFRSEFLTLGRIRPIHTNAVVFAFVGNAIFASIYYSVPRLCKARVYSDILGYLHFWGWQILIALGLLSFSLGFTTGKEYAELEWPFDIWLTIIWVAFGVNIFMTLVKRREKHLYVSIWFFIASWVAVAILHIVNSLEMPVSVLKSYPVYAGVQDALVQWWYGHNAVAFFLTTPFLGMMYYFLPKAAGRPIYSYKLSIIHFWSLIFIYIWAGPHHLLYTALPEWVQTLGTVFSIMLIAPSWGGMVNGLFTLRGAWDKVSDNPILKFFVISLIGYGMATFEGPMLALKTFNILSHYTDWTIAHVHVGTLVFNGFMIFGMLYWLLPKIYDTKIYSIKLANAHFWIALVGAIIYLVPLYWGAFRQTLMWKQFTEEGILQYSFLDTVKYIIPFYATRAVGGSIYLFGVFLMAFNLYKTVRQGKLIREQEAQATSYKLESQEHSDEQEKKYWHKKLEGRPLQLLILSLIVLLIGSMVEIIPTFLIKNNVPTISSIKPYTPLELEGRDIYIKEGCNNCHSQMIRVTRADDTRFGEYSKAGEFVYDHPFLWGSKRTGPDLHREGSLRPNAWHYEHMLEPVTKSEGSIMPPYPWLFEKMVNIPGVVAKIKVMRTLGVPYPKDYEDRAVKIYLRQASEIVHDLHSQGIETFKESEIVALIAYLQRLGKDIKSGTVSEADLIHQNHNH
ncbi:MAG: cytochrome-c oxidase, cbb3-type subunit I [Solitalea-like symbiont of Tyrophagus putrescentiae]